ncbi:hypothetical protein ACOSQ4_030601 [Xanthoceras sorbifolium]
MESIRLASGFSIADLYPSIGLLEVITGMKSKFKKLHQEQDRILGDILNEHKDRKQNMKTGQGKAEEDLVDVFLRLQQDGDLEFPLTDNNIEAVIWSCQSNGHEIPAKTRTIVNAWAIARDPKYWIELEKFNPERFLDNLELPLAQMLYHFDWKLPNGMKEDDLDMTEIFGLTVKRKNDLMLLLIPYHPFSDNK